MANLVCDESSLRIQSISHDFSSGPQHLPQTQETNSYDPGIGAIKER